MEATGKNNWVFLLSLTLALVLSGAGPSGGQEVSEYGNPCTWMTVGKVAVNAEVVNTPEKIYLGLSYREKLPEGFGMLFAMPRLAVQYFCMRGMKFPLDFLWIVPDKIVGINKNVPPQYQGTLVSPAPVNYVLEVPGGFCDRYGIKAGDPVSWR